LRILILGNMANDGYSISKAFWKMNVDVDLAVNSSEFGMGLPEWEDGDISTNIDPYNTHRDKIRNASISKRVRYFDLLNKVPRKKRTLAKATVKINLIMMIREYDIVEVHILFVIYSHFLESQMWNLTQAKFVISLTKKDEWLIWLEEVTLRQGV
jgi:hypothetical protein